MWIIILSCILCPLTFFGTPSEFWPAAAGALATTSLAVVLILTDTVEILQQNVEQNITVPTSEVSLKSLFLAFGTVMFAYGGTASFPTFQNDMKDKSKFSQSVIVGFVGAY
jgi:vesicular inhibitory amino acid transporter